MNFIKKNNLSFFSLLIFSSALYGDPSVSAAAIKTVSNLSPPILTNAWKYLSDHIGQPAGQILSGGYNLGKTVAVDLPTRFGNYLASTETFRAVPQSENVVKNAGYWALGAIPLTLGYKGARWGMKKYSHAKPDNYNNFNTRLNNIVEPNINVRQQNNAPPEPISDELRKLRSDFKVTSTYVMEQFLNKIKEKINENAIPTSAQAKKINDLLDKVIVLHDSRKYFFDYISPSYYWYAYPAIHTIQRIKNSKSNGNSRYTGDDIIEITNAINNLEKYWADSLSGDVAHLIGSLWDSNRQNPQR